MLKFMERFDRVMTAATFAQANSHTTAREIMQTRPRQAKRKRVKAPLRPRQENRPRMHM